MLKILTFSFVIAASSFVPSMNSSLQQSVSIFHPREASSLQQSSWYTSAVQQLQQKEYTFSPGTKAGTYTTPNRRNNLRFHYSSKGFTVEPRITPISTSKLDAVQSANKHHFKNIPDWQVAFNLDKNQLGDGIWKVTGNQAEYSTPGIIVQYINNEQGMRQNFIVQQPLVASGDLQLHFNIKTSLQVQLQNKRLQFIHPQEGVVLNYDQLKVWDATGRPLEATFEKAEKDYCIHVQSEQAVYPITIDPISTTPAASVESNQASAFLGVSVANAGDVNGDGYSDVIVGAHGYDNGQSNEGAVFIYYGSATGISTTAVISMESDLAGAYMGASVAGAGDVNGDGYSDVIVGAYGYNNGQNNEGAAFIYHGSATGINTTPAARVESNNPGALMGASVASAGDVNGDGYSDVIVGAYGYSNGQTREGAAFIYHGSATGINTTAVASIESNQASANMGISVASAGDVNGDGYGDVIVGAFQFDNGQIEQGGAAFIYHGSSAGINTTPAAQVESDQAHSFMGYSVAGAGDVNGDGYSDVIVGAFLYENGQTQEGAAFIYHGAAAGINTTAATTIESNQSGAYMGRCVASAGDLNGDGYSDVIVGAYAYDNGQNDEGAAFIYQGSATGISSTVVAMLESDQAGAYMGFSVASAGDVNGDGYSDIIVGAYLYDNGQSDEGAAFVYHGNNAGVNKQNDQRLSSLTRPGNNTQLLSGNETVTITAFPNPATDVLRLRLNNPYTSMNVQIINAAGQIVKQLNKIATAQVINISVSNLPSGTYFLHLQSHTQKQILQFIKQ